MRSYTPAPSVFRVKVSLYESQETTVWSLSSRRASVNVSWRWPIITH